MNNTFDLETWKKKFKTEFAEENKRKEIGSVRSELLKYLSYRYDDYENESYETWRETLLELPDLPTENINEYTAVLLTVIDEISRSDDPYIDKRHIIHMKAMYL